MKKRWLYIAFVISILISLFYDKQIVLLIAQNRIVLLDMIFTKITKTSTIIIAFLIISIIFFWKKKKDTILLWLSAGVTALITIITKIIIFRPRPFETLTLPLIQGAKYIFATWNTSFPSMHSATAFSIVPILDEEFPKLKWLWITIALIVALSRVYVGVHYLSDVIAGCLIGLVVGIGITKLKKNKLFKKWTKK